MTAVHMRRACADDIPVLQQWDADPDVRAASGDDAEWEWAAEIGAPWQEVWIAEVARRPVGVLILLDAHREPSRYWGEVSPGTAAIDIWIGSPDNRGHGYGRSMMHWALDRAHRGWGYTRVLIDPLITNWRAIRFYRSCGFTDVGERHFGSDHCWVMEVQVGDPTSVTSTRPPGARPAPAGPAHRPSARRERSGERHRGAAATAVASSSATRQHQR